MKKLLGVSLTGAFLACSSPSAQPPAPTASGADAPSSNEGARALHAFFEAQWQRQLAEQPVFASTLGERRHNRSWADYSLAGFEARAVRDREALATLQRFSLDALSLQDRISARLLGRQLRDSIRDFELGAHMMPVSHRGGVQTLDQLARRIPLETVEDYDDWLTRMKKIDTVIEQTLALMRAGLERGITAPRVVMERVPRQIAVQVVADPTDSGFYRPFADLPESWEARGRLRSEAIDVIENVVVPAYRRLQLYFDETYLPGCRETIAATELPNGQAWYAHAIAHYTTTELGAAEIHQIGLKEVARIRAEMVAIKEEVGFEGDFDAFLDYLRSDPRFFFETPEELFEAYRAMAKRIDPELVKLFGKLPRIPYGVAAIPAAIAPDTTTAYYQPPAADGSRAGFYFVNLYDVKSRPTWEIPALSVHEAVPGHHLQIALAMELQGLPEFRKHAYVVAFGEGWGLYSERLGYEMGLYDDPYDRFGQLTYDMWRAVRLVVDTGMHAKGWSRERAIEYFMANAPKSELDIKNEIDRYIAWPGQALAYKIGQLEISRLRAQAQEELGDAFDVRGFHDVVLGSGGVPLDVLTDNVQRWIAEQKG